MTNEEAIKVIKATSGGYDDLCQALEMAIKALEESKTEWIPVTERLPKDESKVLVCNKDGKIELTSGSRSTECDGSFIWYTSGWRFGAVVAWMPLPKPYEEGAEE